MMHVVPSICIAGFETILIITTYWYWCDSECTLHTEQGYKTIVWFRTCIAKIFAQLSEVLASIAQDSSKYSEVFSLYTGAFSLNTGG